MPPALDRLLASPSALRLLRSVVNANANVAFTEFPSACLGTTRCALCIAPRRDCRSSRRRDYHSSRTTRGKTPLVRLKDTPRRQNGRRDAGRRKEQLPWTLPPVGVGNEDPNAAAALWAQHLQQRERASPGRSGIRQVWEARRGFDLPTSDTPDAEYLWGTFLKVTDLAFPLILHAAESLRKTGKTYPHLYELCMAYWLPQERWISYTLRLHHQLVVRLKLRKLPLRKLARNGRHRFTPKVYDAFMDIYRTSNERDVYDEVVPALCARGSIAMARRWHTLCTSRGDHPSPQVAAQPAIQFLRATAANPSDPEAELLAIHLNSLKKGEPKLNADLLRRLRGRDTAPVRFDDSLCARMFATRSFPPESIIKGLAMVGVNEIGPQAVRAMAARTRPVSELPSMFETLRANGITLQGCVFSVALETFARQERWHLVQSMLESDQHPDVYGDVKLQQGLLDYYHKEQDLKQAHRTLAILSLFHNDMSTAAWNLLLQAQIRQFNPSQIVQILQTMRGLGVYVTQPTMAMIKQILRTRQRGHRPGRSPRGKFDDLRFVARVLDMILEGGMGPVQPAVWTELLRRYGMSNRFRELRRTVLRLFCWYAPRKGGQFANLPKSSFLDPVTEKLRASPPLIWKLPYYDLPAFVTQKYKMHPLRVLFPPSFQQGLIVWGFRQGLLPNAPTEQSMLSHVPAKKHFRRRFNRSGVLRRLDWSVGLRHVVELRNLGLVVHPHTVVKALQSMFINLFGRGRSKVTENRRMERANIIPYAEYVREANTIWGVPLFREPQHYGKSKYHALMWHPRFDRQIPRRQDVSLDELLGRTWRNRRKPDDDDKPSETARADSNSTSMDESGKD